MAPGGSGDRHCDTALANVGVVVLLFEVGAVLLLARLAIPAQVHRLQLAVGLGQVGEFGYVLGALALMNRYLSSTLFTALVGTVIITVAGSSILVRVVRPSMTRG